MTRHLRVAGLTVVTALLVAFAASCGGGSDDSSSSSPTTPSTPAPAGSSAPAAAGGTALKISGFQYSPNPLTVPAGAKVEVTNADGADHTVTADDKSFDTPVSGGGAASF